jgi:polysaccharide export outer membrane protein
LTTSNVCRRTLPGGKVALAFAFLLALGGCTLMPGQGPSSMEIALLDETEPESPRNFTIVKLDASTVNKLGPQRPASLSNEFSDRIHGKTSIVIGIGDSLIINIWEASPDGLFSTTEQKQISIEVTETDIDRGHRR